MDDESTEQVLAGIKDLKGEMLEQYRNNKERFGEGMMFTAYLTGGVLFLTGLANVVEYATVRDLVLMGGGVAIPIGLKIRWLYVKCQQDKNEKGV